MDCRMCTSNGSCGGMWERKMQFPAQLGLQLPEKSCWMALHCSPLMHLIKQSWSRKGPGKHLQESQQMAPEERVWFWQGWDSHAPGVTVSAAACRYVWIRSPLNFTAWLLWSNSLMVIILDLMNLLNCKPDWNIFRITVSRAVLRGKKWMGDVCMIFFFITSLIFLIDRYLLASVDLACMWEIKRSPYPCSHFFFSACRSFVHWVFPRFLFKKNNIWSLSFFFFLLVISARFSFWHFLLLFFDFHSLFLIYDACLWWASEQKLEPKCILFCISCNIVTQLFSCKSVIYVLRFHSL